MVLFTASRRTVSKVHALYRVPFEFAAVRRRRRCRVLVYRLLLAVLQENGLQLSSQNFQYRRHQLRDHAVKFNTMQRGAGRGLLCLAATELR